MSGGIAYLGPPGTFCEEALIALVGAEAAAREVPKPSITACFDAVAAGEVAQALVVQSFFSQALRLRVVVMVLYRSNLLPVLIAASYKALLAISRLFLSPVKMY